MAELPLYKLIINDILKDIFTGQLRPGDRIPSENELCASYMVSSITAKNALAELSGKGFIVRKKGKGSFVNTEEQLMKIKDFKHSKTNRSMFVSKTIGLIIPSMKTGVDQQLLNYIEKEINQTDYLLTIIITRENQEKETLAIEKLKQQGASGLIIFPTEHEIYNESILRLNIEKYPFVLVDRYLKGIRTNTVCTNNYEITKAAITHMIASSCKDLLFISPDSRNTVTEERFSGFKDTLLENNIILSSHNSCVIPLSITDRAQKKALIKKSLFDNPSIDGIFCVNEEITSYIIEILDEALSWEHYMVFAFDYTADSRISHIHQDIPEISKQCVKIIFGAINGTTEPIQLQIPAALHTFGRGDY